MVALLTLSDQQRSICDCSWLSPGHGVSREQSPRLASDRLRIASRIGPDKFYKGGSQEKTPVRRPGFFLLPSPRDRARLVLTCRAIDSVCGLLCRSRWVFFYQRFSLPVATKPSVLKPAEQNGGQVPTMVLSETRGLWLFRVVREGLESTERLGAGGTQRLTYRLRLALEPECLENPTATAREDPRDGADSVGDTQAACGFRYSASKRTPFFQTSKVMAAILRASVRRAISGRIPFASNAA
jgi:hypothetical protein